MDVFGHKAEELPAMSTRPSKEFLFKPPARGKGTDVD